MKVFYNQEEFFLEELTTLSNLLQTLQLENQKGIALAINENVIPKSNWHTHTLQEGDKILLIRASQGG